MYPAHLEALVTEYRICSDDYDPYGTVMGWLFAICDLLHWRDDSPGVPDDWEFSPGAMSGPESDRYEYELLKDLLSGGHTTISHILEFGEILMDVRNYCKENDLDY